MGKRKEIKFRRDGRVYEGRQNGVIFRLYEDREKIKTCAPAYSVTAVDTKNEGREICTAGHQYFHLDAAKEFCQQIAAVRTRPEKRVSTPLHPDTAPDFATHLRFSPLIGISPHTQRLSPILFRRRTIKPTFAASDTPSG